MAARLKLFIDWYSKKLVRGLNDPGPFALPSFYQGDVVPMQVYVVAPNGIYYSQENVGSMALKFAVSATPTGTPTTPAPFVTEFAWSKDTSDGSGFFYSEGVAFNTAELNTFLGAEASKTAYLEMEITEASTITTILQTPVTIKAEIVETGTLTVADGQTPLSLEAANQLYAGKVMGAGETIIMKSPDGSVGVILGVNNDGSLRQDPIQFT